MVAASSQSCCPFFAVKGAQSLHKHKWSNELQKSNPKVIFAGWLEIVAPVMCNEAQESPKTICRKIFSAKQTEPYLFVGIQKWNHLNIGLIFLWLAQFVPCSYFGQPIRCCSHVHPIHGIFRLCYVPKSLLLLFFFFVDWISMTSSLMVHVSHVMWRLVNSPPTGSKLIFKWPYSYCRCWSYVCISISFCYVFMVLVTPSTRILFAVLVPLVFIHLSWSSFVLNWWLSVLLQCSLNCTLRCAGCPANQPSYCPARVLSPYFMIFATFVLPWAWGCCAFFPWGLCTCAFVVLLVE